MEGRAYRVRGRVQGVGFRWWVNRLAERAGIRGSTRNETDGSVLVVAWGGEEQLAELERALRRGPPAARVDGLDRLPDPVPPAPAGFAIER